MSFIAKTVQRTISERPNVRPITEDLFARARAHQPSLSNLVSIIKKIIFLATPGPPWLRPDPPGYTWPPQATAYILEDASFNTYVLHTYIRIYYKENHFFGHTRTPLATPGPPWLHLAPPRLLHTYWRMPPLIHMYYILPGGRSEILPTT